MRIGNVQEARGLFREQDYVHGGLRLIGNESAGDFGAAAFGVGQGGGEFFFQEVREVGSVEDFAGFQFPARLQTFGQR